MIWLTKTSSLCKCNFAIKVLAKCRSWALGNTPTNLTHWGRVTHIYVSKPTIIGSDNGLSPDQRQAIIWTNAGLLLIGHLGTNFSEILIEILTFSFKKMRLKVSSAKRRPFCLGLNAFSAAHNSISFNSRASRDTCKFYRCTSDVMQVSRLFDDKMPSHSFF